MVDARVTRHGATDPVPAPDRLAAARLEISSYEGPYAALGLDDEVILAIAADALNLPATETETVLLASVAGEPAALAALCPIDEVRRRQMATVLHLCRRATGLAPQEAMGRLAPFEGAPAPAGPGVFITRFAVAAAHRGTGLAERLLAAIQAGQPGGPLALHVRASNLPAIRFYTRVGFAAVDEAAGTVLMHRGDA